MWRLSATTVFSLLNISALAQTPPCAWHWLLCLASLCAIFAPVPSVSPPGTFLFFFCFFFCLCEENVLETVCGSYANFRTIVWVSNTSPVMEKMCLHAEHHANVCVGIHMFKCITLPSILCERISCMLLRDRLNLSLLWTVWCSITASPYRTCGARHGALSSPVLE